MIQRLAAFCIVATALATGATGQVEIYSAKTLQAMGHTLAQKRTQFASEDLGRYRNHYTLVAQREATGSSEVHQHEADIFVVVTGHATLVSGGKIVNPRIQKFGEIRGTGILGGERHPLAAGDIVHISASTPHQLVIEDGKEFTYFVVKVTGQ